MSSPLLPACVCECITVSLAIGAYQSTLSSTTNLTHALLGATCIVLMTSCDLRKPLQLPLC